MHLRAKNLSGSNLCFIHSYIVKAALLDFGVIERLIGYFDKICDGTLDANK